MRLLTSSEPMRPDYPLDPGLTVPENAISLKDSLSREAIAEREPRVLSSSELRAFDSSLVRQLVKNGIQSVCCVPFTTSKGLVGCFNLGSVKSACFPVGGLRSAEASWATI